MFFRKKKPGYDQKNYYSPLQKKKGHQEEIKWIRSILIPGTKISLYERVAKFLIYIALRMVIRPRKWINPEKNFKIIDYTFKKISSEDLAFIPSSISFYLVMAFMPILTLVLFVFNIPEIQAIFGDQVENVLSGFIPGLGEVIGDIGDEGADISHGLTAGLAVLLVTSIWIASAGFSKMIYTQSYLFDFNNRGKYWGNRIKGILMVLFLTVFLACALAANILMDKYFVALFPIKHATTVRYIFMLLSLFFGTILLFSLFFRFTPLFKVKFVNILPGAFVTGVPTFLFLILFGYITNLWSYGNYGIVGIIMYIGMASLWITTFIFYGITANAAYNREFIEEALVSRRYKGPQVNKPQKVKYKKIKKQK